MCLRITNFDNSTQTDWYECLNNARDRGIDVIVEGDYLLVKEFGMSQKKAQDILADWFLENRFTWFKKEAVTDRVAG